MKYAIVNTNHGYTLKDLSLDEVAHEILTQDGCEYEIRPTELGHDLYYRQQVANIKWTRSSIYSIEDDLDKATKDIFLKALNNHWLHRDTSSIDVMTMDEFKVYENSLLEDA
jgi:hypothetical protein